MMRAIICDLDGSLMPPSSGLYVSKEVEEKIIELEKRGILVILNSARVIQGVYPLAKQLHMEEFGGYCISCNGCHCMNVRSNETVFEYPIEKEAAIFIWETCKRYGVSPGIAQPEFMLARDMVIGYELDRHNCEVDYLLTNSPKKYIEGPIWKCCISSTKETLDVCFEALKEEIEQHTGLKVLRSTPTMVDIIDGGVDKLVAVDHLLNKLKIDWNDVSVIGDTNSDLGCIEKAGLGVTLENGSEACKVACDLLVPSCFDEGCRVWLDRLLEETK